MHLPGRTMMSEQECSRKVRKPLLSKKGRNAGKPILDKSGNPVYVTVKEANPLKTDRSFVEIEGNVETIAVYTRKCKPATRRMNLSTECYNYFTSTECPYDFRAPQNFQPAKPYITKDKRAWLAMDRTARLEWHLNQTCRALGGVLSEYTVLDD